MTNRRPTITSALLAFALCGGAGAARANSYVEWDRPATAGWDGLAGTPVMKNLNVDLIFWGWGNQLVVNGALASDAQQAVNNVLDTATWLNSGWVFDHSGSNNPPRYLPSNSGGGWEPAVHYYGVSGITPGFWVNDPEAIPSQYLSGQGSGQLDRGNFSSIVNRALAGQFGPPTTFGPASAANLTGLPTGANRLAMVITKGTNSYCITVPEVPQWAHCETVAGFHWNGAVEGVGEPFGASFANDLNYVSHEIVEAMTDPLIFGGWSGTDTDLFVTSVPDEVADECTNFGDNDFPWVTVDPPYDMTNFAGGFSTPGASCLQLIPEQHAPMAATFEYGGNGTQPLALVYVDQNGHVQEVTWSGVRQPASGPYDLGQPSTSPLVKATGKPSIVYSSLVGGERIFVKGTDGAVWMHYNSAWKSLGGFIVGDPQAVVWYWNGTWWTHVFVLGGDDNIYGNGIANNTAYGWGGLPNSGTSFVGSPAVISRNGTSLDLFAVGEDGKMKWTEFTPAGGWTTPSTIGNVSGQPFVSVPGVVQVNQTTTQVMGTFAVNEGYQNMWTASFNGARWTQLSTHGFALPADDGIYGPNHGYGTVANYQYQGTPAIVRGEDGGNRVDVFTVSRTGELWWYFGPTSTTTWSSGNIGGGTNPTGGLDNPPLVDRDVTGDPLAFSRGYQELEVFYRTSAGAIAHMTYTGGAWTTETVAANHPMQ